MDQKKSPQVIYIGIKNGMDANTNEILYSALTGGGFSTVGEWKEYKGKVAKGEDIKKKSIKNRGIEVWQVSMKFVEAFYRKEKNFKILFNVYIEQNFTMQLFRLSELEIKHRAKQRRLVSKAAVGK